MKEKILVIDDEIEIRSVLSEILQDEGYEVFEASDGTEGLEVFNEKKPILVITDIKMPRKDGLSVLKRIRETKSDIDVIILTGHSDEATAIDCLKLGAYDYLLKPLEDIDVFLAAIKRAIQKRNLKLKNRDLVRQLEEMAVKDPLTGLYNFRQLHILLDQEITRSQRYGHALSVLIIDVDHFKDINDNYGHLFGDYVLKKLGEIMQQALRGTDLIFRYGGEEFFILLPETSREEVLNVTERIMDDVRSHWFNYKGKSAMITVSIGGSVFPFQSIDKTELINLADQALYRAKEAGRNRVIFSDISF